MLRITKLTMRNLLGIDEYSIEPGAITIISGRNGKGKSSVLRALQNFVGGGSILSIRNINAGDDEPSDMAMELTGDEGDFILKKNKNGLDVKRRIGNSAAFEKIDTTPQRFLDNLFDGRLSNPLEFCRVDDKTRVQLLLEALNLTYSRTELFDSMGLQYEDFPPVAQGMHPLYEIAEHRKNIFERRTGINRDEKRMRSTADEIRREIPAEIPKCEDLEEIENKIFQLNSNIIQKRGEIHNRYEQAEMETNRQVHEEYAQIEFLFMEYKNELQKEMETKLEERREFDRKRIYEITKKAEEIRNSIKSNMEEDLLEIVPMEEEKLFLKCNESAAHEKAKQSAAFTALKQQADKSERSADSLKGEADLLTVALQRLDAYKAAMVEHLPIDGLDITEGKITVYGVPWDQVNTARKYDIAMQIACLRFGDKFRPIFADGIEALDSDNFQIFCDTLERYNAQAFLAMVDDGDLQTKVVK
jgi:hypothetical protein